MSWQCRRLDIGIISPLQAPTSSDGLFSSAFAMLFLLDASYSVHVSAGCAIKINTGDVFIHVLCPPHDTELRNFKRQKVESDDMNDMFYSVFSLERIVTGHRTIRPVVVGSILTGFNVHTSRRSQWRHAKDTSRSSQIIFDDDEGYAESKLISRLICALYLRFHEVWCAQHRL